MPGRTHPRYVCVHAYVKGVSTSVLSLQADIPTTMGVGPGATPATESMETDKDPNSAPPPPDKKYYIDSTYLYTPRENVELVSPLKDGLSE